MHEIGVPRFVRVLGTGGRELTDAIATDLDLPPETAEALKRQLGETHARHDELVARARTSIDRPLSVLLDEVRSSIDYYRNQPGSSPLLRIVVDRRRGAASRADRAAVGARRRAGRAARPCTSSSRIGDIGFADDELPRLDPYLPAAVGLALGGAGVGTVIDLLPRHAAQRGLEAARADLDRRSIAAGAAFVVVLGGVTFLAHQSVSHAKSQHAAVAAQITHVQRRAEHARSPCSTGEHQISALQVEPHDAARDRRRVADDDRPHHREPARRASRSRRSRARRRRPCPRRGGRAAAATASTTRRSSSSGSSSSADRPRTTLPPAAAAADDLGHDHVPGHWRKDYPTLASWIDAMGKVPQIADVYVTSAQKVPTRRSGASSGLTFTATAESRPARAERPARTST